MLRLALLENLRRVVVRVAAGRRERERAAYWIDRMLEVAASAPAKVVLVLADMVKENPPLTTPFIAEFASRMQGQGQALIFPITWLEHRVAEQGQTIEMAFQQASQHQAADQVSIGNSIGSLRFLGATDWRDFVETMSGVEHILRGDPAGVYPHMDFATRDRYRHAVEEIAKRSRLSEDEVAQRAVELSSKGGNGDGERNSRAGHVGYFLISRGRRTLEQSAGHRPTVNQRVRRACGRFPLACYLGSIVIVTAVVTGLIMWWSARHGLGHWELAALGVLLFVCTSQLAVAVINWGAMLLVHPRILPRMDFQKGIPPQHRTIVAVPAILTDNKEIDDLLEAMEVHYLANRDQNLFFALLSDFRDAAQEKMPEDEELLQKARDGIEAINAKYAGGSGGDAAAEEGGKEHANGTGYFFLFHRARRWNACEDLWMGWERKRGKLEDFNGALRGEEGRFDTVVGPTDVLEKVRYVITLDSDTQLPRDSASHLVGTMAHPLNRPRYDEKLGRVTEGYGILQPRVGISMPSASRSGFARLFAGEPGIDPYTHAVSDVYQDVFEEGSFIGKGIYDVDVFRKATHRRLPENRVLSHDLLEGGHARAGLVSDVMLFEEYPSSFPADVSRRSRWIRGDWQIAPWLLPSVLGGEGGRTPNPISSLSQWKILDNVRRSLMPSAMLALLIIGWFLPGGALFYMLVVIGILLLPAILNGAAELTRRPADLPLDQHLRLVGDSISRQVLQQLFVLTTLPYEAFVSIEAIGRTAVRMLVTGRRLLEWRTARDAQRNARTHLSGFYASMWVQPVLALGSALALNVFRNDALVVATPVIVLWFGSPAIAFWLSQPAKLRRPQLGSDDRAFLGNVARRTWRFFETFVGAEDNYLPPDNFQEDPPQGAAHRTSPTNIGMSLLANLAAYDFGYISVAGVIERTTQTLATLDKLQRHRGHFYNWYDTKTLEPLRPLFISTVDSGNLAGHLLTLAAGLDDLAGQKIFRPAIFSGLGTTLDILLEAARVPAAGVPPEIVSRLEVSREGLAMAPRTLAESQTLLQQLAATARELISTFGPDEDAELKWWTEALQRECDQFSEELKILSPWAGKSRLEDMPTLNDAARLEPHNGTTAASENAAKTISELKQLATRCRELADIDYAFLYDKDRHLLSIGYNVGDRRIDSGFYDLLASEVRLASFVAIAQGKLPQEHWFSLGRALTNTGGGMALLSWSGSMFEYLMPLMIMPTYEHTLLDETYHAVVRRQIEYGRERGVPWGVSESGYTKTDAQGNYQYKAFGVPGLGFKRGLADDLVIAPYATRHGADGRCGGGLRESSPSGQPGLSQSLRILRGDRLFTVAAGTGTRERHRAIIYGASSGDVAAFVGLFAARPADAAAF